MLLRSLITGVLAALACAAQNEPHIRDWKSPPGDPVVQPKARCSGLHALTGYEFTVITATEHPASGEAPAFCRVMGQVMPAIRFEVALPASWNRRLYMFGNGGYAGENLEAPGRVQRRNGALKLGFAVTQTNTGHDAVEEPLGTFARDPQKLYDYAFRAVHLTAETAKRIAAAYYGSGPARSYFHGCSTGGRQGLIEAQRFPQDFDGIVVGAPALNLTGNRLRAVANVKALAQAAIPVAKLKLLAGRVYEQCDEKDGLRDGLIDDPRQCGFKPSEHLPVCAGGDSAECFTKEQVRTLETIYADVKSQGKRLFSGYPVGAEIADPNGRSGWDGWIVRDGGMGQGAVYAESFFRHFPVPQRDPNYDLTTFDLDRDASSIVPIGKVFDATDTDLAPFRSRGGKILMYFGWADPALSPLMGTEYYDAVTERFGTGTRDFFRLYMMPGVFHCSGGVGPASFDPLAPLVNWVEKGTAPERLVAAQVANGHVTRTRPLCPYPQVARYKGSGSVNEAANFVCAEPQR